ncbi:MAG: hypothetical protein V1787_06085 [Candidatus Micrarchaeota archaeon]
MKKFALFFFILPSLIIALPIGFEKWENGTAWGVLWNNHTEKNTYYYQDGLTSVSNIPGQWWEKRSWGITWGTSIQNLMNNRIETSNLTNWSYENQTDGVQYVYVTAQKNFTLMGRNVHATKTAVLSNYPSSNSIEETYLLKLSDGNPVSNIWFYQRSHNLDIGGNNDSNDMLSIGYLGAGETWINLSDVTSIQVYDGSTFEYARLFFLDSQSLQNMDFVVDNTSEWKIIITPDAPRAQIIFAVKAGSFYSGETKSLTTYWTDNEQRIGCAYQISHVNTYVNNSEPNTEINTSMGCGYSFTQPQIGSCSVYWDYFKQEEDVPATYYKITANYHSGNVNNSVPRISDGSANPLAFGSNIIKSKNVTLGRQDQRFESNQSWGGCYVSGVTDYQWFWIAHDVTAPLAYANYTNEWYPDTVNLTCWGQDNTKLEKLELWGNWSSWSGKENKTFDAVYTGSANFNVSNLTPGAYTWNCKAYDTAYNSSFNNTNGTFYVPETPLVEAIYPENNTVIGDLSSNFTCNATDAYGLEKISLFGDFFGDWQVIQTNSSPINNSITNFTVAGIWSGLHKWSCFAENIHNATALSSNNTIRSSQPCGAINKSAILYQNVSSSGTCYSIIENNIVLDCNGFTINYSTSAGSGHPGIRWNGNDNITIVNCTINEGSISSNSGGIDLEFSNDSKIINNKIITQGLDSHGMVGSNVNFIEIGNNSINCTGSSSGMFLESFKSGESHDNTIAAGERAVILIHDGSGQSSDNVFERDKYDGKQNGITIQGGSNNSFQDSAITYCKTGCSGQYADIELSANSGNNNFLNSSLNQSSIVFGSGTNNITIEWYLDISVTGEELNDNDSGLVSLWHMNEGSGQLVSDSSGNNNTGVLGNGTDTQGIDPNWMQGVYYTGLNMNATGKVKVNGTLELAPRDNLTLETWAKVTRNDTSDLGALITKYYEITTPRNATYFLGTYGNTLMFAVYGDTVHMGMQGFINWSLRDGKWHHIVAVYGFDNVTPTMGLFVDGKADKQFNIGPGHLANSSGVDVYIGACAQSPGCQTESVFAGIQDEVAIYNRTKNGTEVLNDYMNGRIANATVNVTDSLNSTNYNNLQTNDDGLTGYIKIRELFANGSFNYDGGCVNQANLQCNSPITISAEKDANYSINQTILNISKTNRIRLVLPFIG